MRQVRAALLRLRGVFSGASGERELDAELESHLHMHIDDNLRAGMTPERARREALIKLGGVQSVRQSYREQHGIPMIEATAQDVRYGIRLLVRHRAFSVVAILTLALGIGASTAMFSLVDAIMLRPVSLNAPEQLVVLYETNRDRGIHTFNGSAANYVDWQKASSAFAHLAAWEQRADNRSDGQTPEQVQGAVASAAFFPALQITPHRGRFFNAEEDTPKGRFVAVLGYDYWQRAFNGADDAVGSAITLNGEAHVIVGVMPPLRPPFKADLWRPLAADPATLDRGDHSLIVAGRLAAGRTMAEAEAELQTVALGLAEAYPESNRGWSVRAESLYDALVPAATRRSMLVLLAAVGSLLLIACVNVASLTLARATERVHELTTRRALGAGSGRLIRQLLTESVVLAGAGALLGVFSAVWTLDLVRWLYPADIIGLAEARLSPLAVLVASFLAAGATIIFGLIPAVQAARRSGALLATGTRTFTATGSVRRLRDSFVVAEVALALVLLAASGLLLRSVAQLQRVPLGFSADQVFTAKIGLHDARYESLTEYVGFVERLLSRLGEQRGLSAYGVSSSVPFGGGYTVMQVRTTAERDQPSAEGSLTQWRVIGGDYFSALGFPPVAGRLFTNADDASVPRVTIISQSLAERLYPGQDPVGRDLLVGDSRRPYRIVGVAGAARLTALDRDAEPTIYFHYRQFSWPSLTIVARSTGAATPLAAAIRSAVGAVDPTQPVFDERQMADVVAGAAATPRMNAALVTLFAVLSVTLAAIGVFGVLNYNAAQRSKEMGLRMALGARPREIFLLVCGAGLWLTTAGLGIGLLGAIAAGQLVEDMLFAISALDPLTYLGALATMLVVALIACAVPAWRTAQIDPASTLRRD